MQSLSSLLRAGQSASTSPTRKRHSTTPTCHRHPAVARRLFCGNTSAAVGAAGTVAEPGPLPPGRNPRSRWLLRPHIRLACPWSQTPMASGRCIVGPVPMHLVGKCFNCLADTHVRAECTFPSRCFRCMEEGHQERRCLLLGHGGGKRGRSPGRGPGRHRFGRRSFSPSHRASPVDTISARSASTGRSPSVPPPPPPRPRAADLGAGDLALRRAALS